MTFTKKSFSLLCVELAQRDNRLQVILDRWGMPPYWVRPNTFASLVLSILEQQVSLASAFSAYQKLGRRMQGKVMPTAFLLLTDDDLRACAFTRQKMGYARGLAQAIASGNLRLLTLSYLPDEEVRRQLTALKGIGTWTADIYLMQVLRRTDIFPLGDLALRSALKSVYALPLDAPYPVLEAIGEAWRPLRSIGTMVLWHEYLSVRKKATI